LAYRQRTQKVCNRPHSAPTPPRRSLLGKDHDEALEHHHTVARHATTDRTKLLELV